MNRYIVGFDIANDAIDPLVGFKVDDDLTTVVIQSEITLSFSTEPVTMEVPLKELLKHSCFYIYDTKEMKVVTLW